jgi:hypothetical protein
MEGSAVAGLLPVVAAIQAATRRGPADFAANRRIRSAECG